MPTNAEMIRLLGKIGSDRRTVKTTLLTHLRHQPSGTPARRMPSQMRFSAARKAELSLIGLARKRRRVKWGSRSPMATPYSVVGRYPGKTTTKAMIVMASSAAQTKAIVTARLSALARLFPIRRALNVRVPNIVQPLKSLGDYITKAL